MSGASACGVGGASGPVAAMIVAVHVEQDEALVPLGDVVEQLRQHPVICGVDRQRAADQRFVRLGPLPDLQPPALLGASIDRAVGAAIEIELEARAMHDDMGRHVHDALAGERILLAQPLGILERHRLGDFLAELVTVVDGGRDDRAGAMLDGPPTLS